ncbi:UvrB/UvrC motif-containing protein [Calidifontibacillus erzurumensis]|uniref:UvrB/UvrC motif-containing protein n=1 Tax=Calidifontibacillus erzurumensis TaxID=2741433 RepID=A0A8J8GFC9_9BACI|nr:UvrB/UvrC motif-containing protein [Calidifontibacillus erzurumensis]NSL52622.1 UvrB/UvrC motif-containing protein [Calidifontibacillus erzurumensis]
MECQECHQNPASVHFTKIINGQKTETHLCEQCAREKGEWFPGAGGFSISNLLSGLLNLDYPLANTSTNKPFGTIGVNQCPRCGMTFQQFSKIGRFGCSNCYETFHSQLDPILRRVHSGNTVHHGKIPKRIGGHLHLSKEISRLKEQLQKAIQYEEFEKAAELRDKIRSLEQLLQDQRGGEQ